LQGYFCEAVNSTAVRTHGAAKPKGLAGQDFAVLIIPFTPFYVNTKRRFEAYAAAAGGNVFVDLADKRCYNIHKLFYPPSRRRIKKASILSERQASS
jgi:hypothetical protein